MKNQTLVIEKLLKEVPLTYKIDIAVLERYQSFSAELLRLSLLGIAGYGFLIANIVLKVSTNGEYSLLNELTNNKYLLAIGAAALGISAASALGHRYFSTDCLTHFVRLLRLRKTLDDVTDETRKARDKIINHEEKSLDSDLFKCKWLLIFSCASLVIGVTFVAVAFAITLFK